MAFVAEDDITSLAGQAVADSALAAARGADGRPGAAPARVRPRGSVDRGGAAGRHRPIGDDKRQEFIPASDVLGLSMLVGQLSNRSSGKATRPRPEGRRGPTE